MVVFPCCTLFSNYGSGDDGEDVVVGFLGDLVSMAGKQAPEVTLSRVRRHVTDHRQDLILSPVITSHGQNARRLSVGTVQIFQVASLNSCTWPCREATSILTSVAPSRGKASRKECGSSFPRPRSSTGSGLGRLQTCGDLIPAEQTELERHRR